ncbi:MAG: hypothetical protein CM15mP106_4650 [Candidatus Neomarinimicrobiota bacterium]|nr:MAG: hypothetical protein CM15mP106_4650 [Candidatus Neomarinimicrobiota bacterium]
MKRYNIGKKVMFQIRDRILLAVVSQKPKHSDYDEKDMYNK